jgi:hypoxanthine phosphoribosyltransferase
MNLSKPKRITKYTKKSSHKDVEGILISEDSIQKRVKQINKALIKEYNDKDLLIIPLLSGTVLFFADLLRGLPLHLRIDYIGVSSYYSGTESRNLTFTKDLKLEINGAHVLIVDDILDSGKTLSAVVNKIQKLNPASIKTCVLLDKKERRVVNIEADYVGFEVPNLFVIGYGLDFDERYRNLPYIGVLKSNVYA